MIAIFLLVFAALSFLGTLGIIANSRLGRGTRAFTALYHLAVIVIQVLAAVQLTKGK